MSGVVSKKVACLRAQSRSARPVSESSTAARSARLNPRHDPASSLALASSPGLTMSCGPSRSRVHDPVLASPRACLALAPARDVGWPASASTPLS